MPCCPPGNTKTNGAHGICHRPTPRAALFHWLVEISRWLVSLSLVIMPRRKRPNPQSEENIRRIDTKSRAKKQTHGFQVHFLRGDRVVTKMFSDNVFGGKQAARRAARKFKNSMLRRLPRRKFLGG
jgi:hypothetical protein